MIKGIIFDKDGTLFDFNATWGTWTRAMLEAETAHDPALFDPLAEALGYDTDQNRFLPDSLVIAATAGETADRIRSVLPQLDRQALLARMNDAAAQVPQVETVPLIAYFTNLRQAGLRLGIATNDAEAPARIHLERAGVNAMFDFVAGYDSGYGGKPAPGQLLAFCDQTGLRPDECLMVGDSTHDLHAGRAAGMGTVGVLTGPAPAEELSAIADAVLQHIGEIPDWLRSQTPPMI
ncbi:HAD family hydrolase [Yoonia sp.]|uniref:HAD family hydrolase n=1 Tax=Yoonia sp. TaxID=2212373 RepID=UPI0023B3E9B1